MGWLTLTRAVDEKIMIGDDIEVMVGEIRSDKVRLLVRAPADVKVWRREIFDKIKRQLAEKPCANCNQPGSHFVPPSLGESGFYICEELAAAKQSAEGGGK